MFRRLARFTLIVVVSAVVAAAIVRLALGRSRRDADLPIDWPPLSPDDVPAPPSTNEADQPWIVSEGGACPASHPVKAKLSSGIYHVPGGTNYERTNADRCYADSTAAEADGLRASKR